MHRRRWISGWIGETLVCGILLLSVALFAFASDTRTVLRGDEDYRDPVVSGEVRLLFSDGDAEIEADENRRGVRRLPSMIRGGTCGQIDDCAVREGEDVSFVLDIPTSGYWSFSLCGSSFDTYLAVGTAPCTADIGYNDDFCGTNSLAGCLFVQAGLVYVTIESGANTCGKFTFTVAPCVPGRCCYMLGDSALCENTTIDDCAAIGGEWDGDKTCENDPCPTGRCCYRENGVTFCTENMLEKPCLFTHDGAWLENGTCAEPCDFGADTSECGPLDLVLAIDVSGSMTEELDAVRDQAEQLLQRAAEVSGADLRASLVVFREYVEVRSQLTSDLGAVAESFVGLVAEGGASPGEPSDEALREIITQDGGECLFGEGFMEEFRPHAVKMIVLVTDEINSACNEHPSWTYAHQRALDADSLGIHISSVYVEPGAPSLPIERVMRNYAATTGGLYVVAPLGAGLADQIGRIIAQCGQLGLSLVGSAAPTIGCDAQGYTPIDFDATFDVSNQGDRVIDSGVLWISQGTGPGGTGIANGTNPMAIGAVEPQDTVSVPVSLHIEPSSTSGCINFRAFLLMNDDTVSTYALCVMTPQSTLDIVASQTPTLTCDESGVTPTTFDISVFVRNPTNCGTTLGSIAFGAGSGPGGTGIPASSNPIPLGYVAGGDTFAATMSVTISPANAGGCIRFPATLVFDADTIEIHNVCVSVPRTQIALGHHDVPELVCAGGAITPQAFDIHVTVRNTSTCGTSQGQVFVSSGHGLGGTGMVTSPNPVLLDFLAPGDSVEVPASVAITPSPRGGCITFRACVLLAGDSVSCRNICVAVPQYGVQVESATHPELICENDQLSPTSFELSVSILNSSDCDLEGGALTVLNGVGGGGTGSVTSSMPIELGLIPAHLDTVVPVSVTIAPLDRGGTIRFGSRLEISGQVVSTRSLAVNVPLCGCASSDSIQISSNGYGACACVYMCNLSDIPLAVCRPAGARPHPPTWIFFGACADSCEQGHATISNSQWTLVGNCWRNIIHPQNEGCIRLCIDFELPVELSGFEAIPEFERIRLRWSTASEQDLDRFEVERDGALVSVLSAENSPTGAGYEWTDTYVESGREYEYSLFSVDFGGARQELATESASPLSRPVMITDYALLPNYPNPFNGTTVIGFELPESQEVVLTAYDVRGRKVADIARGRYGAGRHGIVFDGAGLPSGLYFCRMQAGEFATRQKMLLLK